MKILLVNKFYYPKGGAEIYFFALSKLLAMKGHQVIPFAMDHPKNLPSPYNKYFVSFINTENLIWSFNSLKTVGRFLYSFEAKKKIKKLIKDTRPDIAHIHNIYHQISPSILSTLKKYNIPVVMTVHDWKLIAPNYNLYPRDFGKKYYKHFFNKSVKNSYLASFICLSEFYFHKILKFYEKYIDVFICPSKFLACNLKERGFKGRQMVVLPNFIDLTEYKPNFKVGNYILYVGRLSKEKGLETLIKAVRFTDNKIKLKIIGEGPDQKSYKLQATSYKLNDRIEFLGYRQDEELKKIIQNSMFLVVPSLAYEICPMVILEAFASGKTVIASEIGGIPELVEKGKIGLLFKKGDLKDLTLKINWFLKNPEKIEEMGRNGQRLVREKYSPEKHYEKLFEIYKKLIK